MRIGVIGGGASGVVCAIKSKNENNEVVVFEKNNVLLKKLLLTGNGRCNFWNEDQSNIHYHSSNEEFLNAFLTDAKKEEAYNFFLNLGIVPRIKNGYYYPFSNQATSIKNALIKELEIKNIIVKTNYNVLKIEKKSNVFYINGDEAFDIIVIATGGCAYPKTGSDGSGYLLAKNFKHNVTKVSPSLVQLKGDYKYNKDWAGVRSEVKVSIVSKEFVKTEIGEILFTEYGLSGICIFNLSRYYQEGSYISINFLPYDNFLEKQMNFVKNRTISDVLEGFLNYKLIKGILRISNINENDKWVSISDTQKENLLKNLTDFRVYLTGTLDFNHSEVTKGGVPLSEVNNNLESKNVKNLYFTGEVLDVDGDCGGYNLGFAWMSGIAVGNDISKKMSN